MTNTSNVFPKKELGIKITELNDLVDIFEHQEGEIQHIVGKTGNGKTYEATRRALAYLKEGKTVYTTWQMILPENYDERQSRWTVLKNILLLRKRFYKFDFRKNWHHVDIDRPDLVEFIAGLTDCIVFLDEGQDIFDSYEGTGMSKAKRKSLTRTRHLRKTLVIVSQRPQAVAVTARANVTFYYKCVKSTKWYWPFHNHFTVYRTEEMDNQNLPIFEDLMTGWRAPKWYTGFSRKEVYNAYNSWYLRAGIPKSQEVSFEAYDLSFEEKLALLFSRMKKPDLLMSKGELIALEERNKQKFLEYTRIEEKKKVKSKLSTPVEK